MSPGKNKVIKETAAQIILTSNGFKPKYSATPPQTPPRYLSFDLLNFIYISMKIIALFCILIYFNHDPKPTPIKVAKA